MQNVFPTEVILKMSQELLVIFVTYTAIWFPYINVRQKVSSYSEIIEPSISRDTIGNYSK